MKNYSSYYPSSKVVKKNNVDTWFYNMVNQSEDGCEPIINGIKVPCLIQQHTNPMDEYKEDRKLITLINTLKKGDIIKNYVNDTWIIVTDIDLDCYYYTCKIRKCNNELKWKDHYENIHEYPCIVTQDTFYNTGIAVTKPMVLGDGKLTTLVTKNKYTKNIKRDMRFIFEDYVYQVTYVDTITLANKDNGLIVLKMEEVEEINGDNFENQIANNSITPLQIIIEGENLVNVENKIKLNAIIKRGSEVVNEDIVWTSSDNTIITVDGNGFVTGIDVGKCNITCQLKNNPRISNSITIEVIKDIQDNISYEVTTDFDIDPFVVPEGLGQTITIHKYNNGQEVKGDFEFQLDLQEIKKKDIEFKIINSNQCYIKNINISNKISIALIAIDIDNKELIKKEIMLKGLF